MGDGENNDEQQHDEQKQGGGEFAELVHTLRDVSEHLGKLGATTPEAAALKRSLDQGLRYVTHI